MESRESIRNRIIHYARLMWDTDDIANVNPLTGMLIEELCNELYLLDNHISNIDTTILERLSRILAPSQFAYIRPSHAILQIRPGDKHYQLEKYTEFFLKEIPDELKDSGIGSIVFTPVTDLKLNDMTITHILFGQSLWSVNDMGEKTLTAHTDKPASYNTLWLRIEANESIKQMKDLFFYIDFPHLTSNHEYYSLMDYIRWTVHGESVEMKQGIPLKPKEQPGRAEQDILNYYKDRFYTLDISERKTLHNDMMPSELQGVLNPEHLTELQGGCWLSLTFSPHFNPVDISRFRILLNAFPVINRRYNAYTQEAIELTGLFTLPSEIGEEFLSIDNITDISGNKYKLQDSVNNKQGTYTVEAIQKKAIEDPRIAEYLEQLIDLIQDEKAAFPGIDSEHIQAVQESVSTILGSENHRLEQNRLNEYADVAKVQVLLHDNAEGLSVRYWTTLAERANGIAAGTSLMAGTIPALNKSNAVLITECSGARSFYDTECLKAINCFYLTSRDRILTKDDILNYCRIEVGQYVTDIDVMKKVKISKRFKEGLVNVMEIKLTPKIDYAASLKEGSIVKELLLRLRKRSPETYNYTIEVESAFEESIVN